MLKQREITIGSTFKKAHSDEIITICAETIEWATFGLDEAITPIPLSNDMLKDGLSLEISKDGGFVVDDLFVIKTRLNTYSVWKQDQFIKPVEFVHQLQNTIYDLTGKEI
jgi:hypothetical protein